MTLQNIPAEMRAYAQWVLWRYEFEEGDKKPTKLPYMPNGGLASVTNSLTWSTFEAVMAAPIQQHPHYVHPDTPLSQSGFSGIGFVLSSQDPFGFIDLDDISDLATDKQEIALERQKRIFSEFNSYSEISPSGAGLHIIVKGKVPAGRRRDRVEVYSSERYMTMTGRVYRDAPIEDRQELLKILWSQMGSAPSVVTYTGNEPERDSDAIIIARGEGAENGEKFKALFRGNWKELYESQSQADFAFIDMLAFYTQNKEQIKRIFYSCPLGQRKKARFRETGYVDHMVMRSFDRLPPPVDMDGLRNQLELALANKKNATATEVTAAPVSLEHSSPSRSTANGQTTLPGILEEIKEEKHLEKLPPGLLGDMASFIYAASQRQVREVALASSIALMSGIAGRSYNINGAGLNTYTLLLAATGRGKENLALGITKLMNEIKFAVPASSEFLGPNHLMSGQGLLKRINKFPCFVSVLPEFAITLQAISAPNASPPLAMLRQVLLDLYNKSGKDAVLYGAAYSDKEKDIPATQSPALSILAESNPAMFYEVLNESMITGGLLPRIIILEYSGKRMPSNKNHKNVKPEWATIEKLANLTSNALTLAHGHKTIDVQLDPDAEKFLDEFDAFCDSRINDVDAGHVVHELWNRAHMNALKLSGLVAVGCDIYSPRVTLEHAMWARGIIVSNVWNLVRRFERGEIGKDNDEKRQIEEMTRVIRDYLTCDGDNASVVIKYGTSRQLFDAKIIPYQYLSRRLITNAIFKKDRIGATAAIHRTLKQMVETDMLREIPKSDMGAKFSTTQRCYMLNDNSVLQAPKAS